MSILKVEKLINAVSDNPEENNAPQIYQFTYTKTLKDIEGREFEVFDKIENEILEGLQEQLTEINDKIKRINELEMIK